LIDEDTTFVDDEFSPPFRRRRGSSFRSSSEPLTVGGGVSGQKKDEVDVEGEVTTDDEGSDVSPASSRVESPSPGARSPPGAFSPMYVGLPHFHAGMPAGFQRGLEQPFGSRGRAPKTSQFAFSKTSQFAFTKPAQVAGHVSSNSSECGTSGKQPCHVIWCDHRAFKETSNKLKMELETTCGASVKTHKTAENCIRLFRKKQRAQGRPPCVILVSWANAPALLSYLADANHVLAKIIVLRDARSCRKNESADRLLAQFPFVETIACTWEAALESACTAVGAS